MPGWILRCSWLLVGQAWHGEVPGWHPTDPGWTVEVRGYLTAGALLLTWPGLRCSGAREGPGVKRVRPGWLPAAAAAADVDRRGDDVASLLLQSLRAEPIRRLADSPVVAPRLDPISLVGCCVRTGLEVQGWLKKERTPQLDASSKGLSSANRRGPVSRCAAADQKKFSAKTDARRSIKKGRASSLMLALQGTGTHSVSLSSL